MHTYTYTYIYIYIHMYIYIYMYIYVRTRFTASVTAAPRRPAASLVLRTAFLGST